MKSSYRSKRDLLLSGKVLPTIVFIIFPICFTILVLSYPESTNFYPIPLNPIFPITIGLFHIMFTLILLAFAFYPAFYSTSKFFKKRGFENVVIEYQYLKKILYISMFILIALIGLYFYLLTVVNDLTNRMNQEYISAIKSIGNQDQAAEYVKGIHPEIPIIISVGSTVFNVLFLIPIVPLSIIIKLLLEHSRREFRFYYAKGCFKIVSKEDTHQLDKAKYFKTGLIWYNTFLKKNIGLHINDMMKIYSKIITDSPLEQNSALISISESFNSKDGLKPLRDLSTVIPGKEAGEALTKESIRTTIKESSDLLIPIITIIITLITTFLLPKPPSPGS